MDVQAGGCVVADRSNAHECLWECNFNFIFKVRGAGSLGCRAVEVQDVQGCEGLFRAVQGCPGLSRAVKGCPGLCRSRVCNCGASTCVKMWGVISIRIVNPSWPVTCVWPCLHL